MAYLRSGFGPAISLERLVTQSSVARCVAAGLAVLFSALVSGPLLAQAADTTKPKPTKWYDKLSLRGYAQIRYNNLFSSNDSVECAQCDRSLGPNNGFFLRRARLVVSGEVHPRLFVYLQPDLTQGIGTDQMLLQIRDLYGDVYLTAAKTLRVRIGQSKVPYGWENVQSSQNRLPFDRDDALNSGVPNERDLGAMVYWTPNKVRQLARFLVDSGYKGTGDYGLIGFGVYNGQGGNRAEVNGDRHVAGRVSYPFKFGNQYAELGGSYYQGIFTIVSALRTPGVTGPTDFLDERFAVSAVLYPRPLGAQAEWTWGTGPRYSPSANAIQSDHLEGGYLQLDWRTRIAHRPVTPYIRGQYYDGGKKAELDARSYLVREVEFGVEWLALDALELTAAWMDSDRTYEDGLRPDNRQEGSQLRLQAQLNY